MSSPNPPRKPNPPKKNEMLEVRISHEAKTAFMARCRADGRTASDKLRRFIEGELDQGAPPSRRAGIRWRQTLAAAALGLAVGAVGAPSLAHPAANSRAAFDQLDRNHDGVLSFNEFRCG